MVWSPTFRSDIVDSFTRFCGHEYYNQIDGNDPDPKTLDGYIGSWLWWSNGVDWTNHDYTSYLLAVFIIIDAYEKDPTIIYYRGDGKRQPRARHVERILSLEEWGAEFLDPHMYGSLSRGFRSLE